MKMLKKGQKGFTLIELLIVVAIIGILAAIAIPQFSAYRQRAYNSAANSDIKNARTSQDSLLNEFGTYGKTEGTAAAPILLTAVTNGLAGVLSNGPLASATSIVPGLAISGPRNLDGTAIGFGAGLSNAVILEANAGAVPGDPSFGATTFYMTSKHTQGTRVFACEAEQTAIFYSEDTTWAGLPMTAGGGPAAVMANTETAAELTNTTPGGGLPITTWTAL